MLHRTRISQDASGPAHMFMTGGPDSLHNLLFSKMSWIRPVWKCKQVADVDHGAHCNGHRPWALYLFKISKRWMVVHGPANLANYRAFKESQIRRKLHPVWRSSENIMNPNYHCWSLYASQTQKWSCEMYTFDTMLTKRWCTA